MQWKEIKGKGRWEQRPFIKEVKWNEQFHILLGKLYEQLVHARVIKVLYICSLPSI